MSEFQNHLERFEHAWQSKTTPSIYDFIPGQVENRDAILIELIQIDMEHRWRLAPRFDVSRLKDFNTDGNETLLVDSTSPVLEWRPLLDDYRDLLSQELKLSSPPLALILGEYRIRCRWGDRPTHASVAVRFPELQGSILVHLQRIDAEFEERNSFLQHPRKLDAGTDARELLASEIQSGDRLDDFQIISKLGQGAFAHVFLAQQISMQRFVALKVAEQKSNESPVLAGLNHPNIVRVFDERVCRGLHLVYMQYVTGGSLRGVINQLRTAERKGLTCLKYLEAVHAQTKNSMEEHLLLDRRHDMDWSSTVAWVGSNLAAALAYAHAKDIVHCDVKPDNILLTQDGVPLLADFNLSIETQLQTQSAERLGGTLNYMSPEQFEVLLGLKKHADFQTTNDVYSLGIVLYELLRGVSPFSVPKLGSEPTRAILTSHLEARQSFRPSDGWDSETRALGRVLEGVLSSNPNDRPASASILRRQLELIRNKRIRKLLNDPSVEIMPWYRSPMVILFACGLIPNALISPVNIMANHQINIDGFDLHFFRTVEEPVVNAVLFPLGLIVAVALATPIIVARRGVTQGIHKDANRSQGAVRCLQFPWMVALVVFTLWTGSGVIFPLWNLLGAGSNIGPFEFFGFFLSQLLHGLVATGVTAVLVSWATLKWIYPSMISREESAGEQHWLGVLRRLLQQARSMLEVTPLVALLAIAVSEQLEKQVSIALAIVGLLGHLIAANLTPRVEDWINLYHQSLGPMDEIANESRT